MQRATIKSITCVIVAMAWCVPGSADERAPRFADYPEAKISHTRVARPIIPRQWHEEIRLRLSDAVSRTDKPNFAGRYFVAIWGCGSACVSAAIVEARSGRVIPNIPFTVSGWREVHDGFEGVSFRLNSRLIVLSGERDEKGDMGQHFYVLEKGKLRWLKTISNDGNFLKPVE